MPRPRKNDSDELIRLVDECRKYLRTVRETLEDDAKDL